MMKSEDEFNLDAQTAFNRYRERAQIIADMLPREPRCKDKKEKCRPEFEGCQPLTLKGWGKPDALGGKVSQVIPLELIDAKDRAGTVLLDFVPELPDAFAPVARIDGNDLVLDLVQIDGDEPVAPFKGACELRVRVGS